MIFLIFVVYGIGADLGAWEILLQCVSMICLQFWESSKMVQIREVSTFFQRPIFAPNSIKKNIYQPKLSPDGQIGRWTDRWTSHEDIRTDGQELESKKIGVRSLMVPPYLPHRQTVDLYGIDCLYCEKNALLDFLLTLGLLIMRK